MDTKNKLRWILIILAAILIVVQLFNTDFEHFEWVNLLGPLSMLLVILSMIISINQFKKKWKINSP
ncbi:hypothetical protein MTsPCn9_19540 [Croceitalea sp. MTPC9]|nr:hypothetical protein MTsPCn6_12390 [Croceitalea sp. MTPC6]GMN17018.1 hypothetical protein MTsPCn9_19540 [Croceitalea sp. MTPC9]